MTETESIPLEARTAIQATVDAGDYRAAIKLAKALVWNDTSSFDAWQLLGTLYLLDDRHTEAIHSFGRCVALQPNSIAARLDLGHALLARGDGVEALQTFGEVLRLDAANPVARSVTEAMANPDGPRIPELLAQLASGIGARLPRAAPWASDRGPQDVPVKQEPEPAAAPELAAAASFDEANARSLLVPLYKAASPARPTAGLVDGLSPVLAPDSVLAPSGGREGGAAVAPAAAMRPPGADAAVGWSAASAVASQVAPSMPGREAAVHSPTLHFQEPETQTAAVRLPAVNAAPEPVWPDFDLSSEAAAENGGGRGPAGVITYTAPAARSNPGGAAWLSPAAAPAAAQGNRPGGAAGAPATGQPTPGASTPAGAFPLRRGPSEAGVPPGPGMDPAILRRALRGRAPGPLHWLTRLCAGQSVLGGLYYAAGCAILSLSLLNFDTGTAGGSGQIFLLGLVLLLQVPVAILLMVAGIQVLRRRERGRQWLQAACLLGLVLLVCQLLVQCVAGPVGSGPAGAAATEQTYFGAVLRALILALMWRHMSSPAVREAMVC